MKIEDLKVGDEIESDFYTMHTDEVIHIDKDYVITKYYNVDGEVSTNIITEKTILHYKKVEKTVKMYKYAYVGRGGKEPTDSIDYHKDDKDFISYVGYTKWYKRLDYTEVLVPEKHL